MNPDLKAYALRSQEILKGVAPDQIGFHASFTGAGLKGQEHSILLGGCSLDQHLLHGNLEKIAIDASALTGKGNRPLWKTSLHPQSTRKGPSLKDQYITLIAQCLYPGGGGPLGKKLDMTRDTTAVREELNAIALVGRLQGEWPPYVQPGFGKWGPSRGDCWDLCLLLTTTGPGGYRRRTSECCFADTS